MACVSGARTAAEAPWQSVTVWRHALDPDGVGPLDGARRGERPCTIKEESRSDRIELEHW